MGRRESPLEAWCVKWARARGIVVAKLAQVDGIPDRIFFVPGGRPLLIEFKAKDEEVTEWYQLYYLKTLRAAGYDTHQCNSKEQFLKLMEKYGKARSKRPRS